MFILDRFLFNLWFMLDDKMFLCKQYQYHAGTPRFMKQVKTTITLKNDKKKNNDKHEIRGFAVCQALIRLFILHRIKSHGRIAGIENNHKKRKYM